MSHQSVRLLIQDACKSVRDRVVFVYGRTSDVNAIKDKKLPFVNLSPLTSTGSFINDSSTLTTTYAVRLVFYKLDNLQGAEDETAKILDEMSDFADKAIAFLNRSGEDYGESIQLDVTTDDVVITNLRKEPVIKVLTDCLSGWIVELDLTVPDKFDYCSLYE